MILKKKMIMENEKLNNGVISLEGEVWKVINHPSIGDYSNYEISNFGRVKSLNYRHTGKERILKAKKDEKGYLYVSLYKKSEKGKKSEKQRHFKIHRLVAFAFLENPKPDEFNCINHKIEGEKGKSMNFVFFKTNGEVDEERTSIEWVSALYNNTYGTRISRVIESFKKTIETSVAWKEGIKKRAEKLSKTIYQYTTELELVNVYPSTNEAARQTGCNQGKICECCLKKRKSHKGFIWSYSPLPNTSNQLTLFPTITKIS